MADPSFEPKIVGFLCRWCSYTGADLAGTSRIHYPPNVVSVRVMCSGRVDPMFILKALADGADGVLIAGCHPGDCHYDEGNYKTMRRYPLLLQMLDQFGICASSGSACTSGSLEPSHVLRAMGVPFTAAHGSIRYSLSRYNTEEEVDFTIEKMPQIIERLRELSPFVETSPA